MGKWIFECKSLTKNPNKEEQYRIGLCKARQDAVGTDDCIKCDAFEVKVISA